MDIEVTPRNISHGASNDDDNLINNTRYDDDQNELHTNTTERVEAMETNSSPASNDESETEKDTCDNSTNLPNGMSNKDESGDESIEYADAVDVDEEGACFFNLLPDFVEDHAENYLGKYPTLSISHRHRRIAH